ncbi:MAG TPA: acyl-CoA dehydrogenase family protein [Solirubrobacterales bacterium]|jgi:alkylation response protein AidB-like acyl-CoA dehydrogenase
MPRRAIFEDEHEAFRESVRTFLRREAAPHAERWEQEGMVDREFWRKAGAAGFVGFQAPAELGGLDLEDFRFNAILDEEIEYGAIPGDNFALQNDIVAPYLVELTTDEQKARWLPAFTAGELIGAVAMSEPGAGSDLRAIATTATPTDGGWKLDGSKTFVTSGIQADLVIVVARTASGDGHAYSLFAVEAGTPGFERGRKLSKVGRKAQDTAELFFRDAEVPAENLIGGEGEGLHMLMRNLPRERLSIAISAVAASERALELTLEYVGERRAFGRPVGSFQANRFALADLTNRVRAARVYVDHCIAAVNAGELSDAEAAGAKAWTTELQFEVLDRCLQLHGGYGYMDEYEISRLWRDARVQRIYGGTNEVMLEIVGRSLGL